MSAPPHGKIPRPTVKRLSLYLRELETRAEQDQQTMSSKQLGQALGLTDAQVRKDLAYFGQFGHPGIGYRVGELTDQAWHRVVLSQTLKRGHGTNREHLTLLGSGVQGQRLEIHDCPGHVFRKAVESGSAS